MLLRSLFLCLTLVSASLAIKCYTCLFTEDEKDTSEDTSCVTQPTETKCEEKHCFYAFGKGKQPEADKNIRFKSMGCSKDEVERKEGCEEDSMTDLGDLPPGTICTCSKDLCNNSSLPSILATNYSSAPLATPTYLTALLSFSMLQVL